MTKGTDFGGVHSSRDLNLIQQKVEIQPAEPKLNLVDIPGADGSKDLSDRPAGRVVYNDRTLTWTFALYPGENWHNKHRQVSNALNGRRCKITLDDDPDYYYLGRLVVKDYTTDKLLRQITVEAVCSPWLLKQDMTVVTLEVDDTDAEYELVLNNEKKPAILTIDSSIYTYIELNGDGIYIDPGKFTSLDLELQEGENILRAYQHNMTGTITITYQEGSL